MSRDKAARVLQRQVPADATLAVRAYVMAPAGTRAQALTFKLTTLDGKRESDSSQTNFQTPDDQTPDSE